MVERGGRRSGLDDTLHWSLEDESTAFCAVRAAHPDVDYAAQPHHRTTPPAVLLGLCPYPAFWSSRPPAAPLPPLSLRCVYDRRHRLCALFVIISLM